jgi:hypothetical protein
MVLQQQGAVTAAAEGGINQTGGRFAGPCREGGEGLPHLIGKNGEVGEGIHGPFLSGSGRGSDQEKAGAESRRGTRRGSRRGTNRPDPKQHPQDFYQ